MYALACLVLVNVHVGSPELTQRIPCIEGEVTERRVCCHLRLTRSAGVFCGIWNVHDASQVHEINKETWQLLVITTVPSP